MATLYPLSGLLKVRLFREAEAEKIVRAAELELRLAEDESAKRREDLKNYRVWRSEEVERRYAAIINTLVSSGELGIFRGGLAALDEGERKRNEEFEAALKTESERAEALARAREQASAMRRETAKIEAHRKTWLDEEVKKGERREEMELEEVVYRQEVK